MALTIKAGEPFHWFGHTYAQGDVIDTTGWTEHAIQELMVKCPVYVDAPAATVPDANATTKGIVQLDNDLGGTAALPRTSRELIYTAAGTLTVKVGTSRLYFEQARTLVSIRASVGTAPVGSSIIVDVKKNGTTIFTTQANRPTIPAGANTSGLVTNMDVTAVAAGDYLTVDVAQVGSTTAGADLTVQIRAL